MKNRYFVRYKYSQSLEPGHRTIGQESAIILSTEEIVSIVQAIKIVNDTLDNHIYTCIDILSLNKL